MKNSNILSARHISTCFVLLLSVSLLFFTSCDKNELVSTDLDTAITNETLNPDFAIDAVDDPIERPVDAAATTLPGLQEMDIDIDMEAITPREVRGEDVDANAPIDPIDNPEPVSNTTTEVSAPEMIGLTSDFTTAIDGYEATTNPADQPDAEDNDDVSRGE